VENPDCPVPFIGRPSKWNNVHTFEEAYTIAGFPEQHVHQGHPPHPSSSFTTRTLIADISSEAFYKKDKATVTQSKTGQTAHEVNKEPYNMAPEHESRAPRGEKGRMSGDYDIMKKCVALICQRLMNRYVEILKLIGKLYEG
jgi:hypothetical protein